MKNSIFFNVRVIYINFLNKLGLIEQESLYYIGGADILPKPLSASEELELIKRLSEGDESAKNTLVERNLRLVVYIAKKFENAGINIEDLISIGTIGLMKAINSFACDKNIKLATYASRCIENEILMYLRKVSKSKREVSIDEPLNTDAEGNDLLLSDILGSDSDSVFKIVEDSNDKKMLMTELRKLNDREKLIMQLRYGFANQKEMTQKEVADFLGISQSYISRIEKKVIFKLKKEITKNE